MSTKSSETAGDVSVQVFLDESVPADRIGPHLEERLAQLGGPGAKHAKLGRVSRLARSVGLKAPPKVVALVQRLPEVVDVLAEDQSDYYPKPVRVQGVKPDRKIG